MWKRERESKTTIQVSVRDVWEHKKRINLKKKRKKVSPDIQRACEYYMAWGCRHSILSFFFFFFFFLILILYALDNILIDIYTCKEHWIITVYTHTQQQQQGTTSSCYIGCGLGLIGERIVSFRYRAWTVKTSGFFFFFSLSVSYSVISTLPSPSRLRTPINTI